MEMKEEALYYVLQTHPGRENKVASDIRKVAGGRDLPVFDVQVPTEKVIEIRNGKRREITRKIYPGYVIVKMILTDNAWYSLRGIRGLVCFAGDGVKPLPLTREEVDKLGLDSSEEELPSAENKPRIEVSYKLDEAVQIIDGPLDGYVGTVCDINYEKGCLKVNVSMFGRETQIELPLDGVMAFV
ncbi:MAG: transcription termination/antitermination protein NusG [Candidatus Improbicoccus devescovinae]|nr:MAG: transcription termination/antitermination protein NusG [Candidatus Improbicoccus devescovinae]